MKEDNRPGTVPPALPVNNEESRKARRAKAQGVLPVRIEIPMIGEIHRFEKFLTVDESPAVVLTYSRRNE